MAVGNCILVYQASRRLNYLMKHSVPSANLLNSRISQLFFVQGCGLLQERDDMQ